MSTINLRTDQLLYSSQLEMVLRFPHFSCVYFGANLIDLIPFGLGHEKIVEMLISADADVNISGAQSWTALHLAAQNGSHYFLFCFIFNVRS